MPTTNEARTLQTKWPSPLAGYENNSPLSDDKNEDGKSYVNPPREGLSDAYETFTAPLDNGTRGALYVTVIRVVQACEQALTL